MPEGVSMPIGDFANPPLSAPPPGLNNEEIDIGEDLRKNASSTNEGTKKLQDVLRYLNMFEENIITEARGYKHIVLSRNTGVIDITFGNHPWAITNTSDDLGPKVTIKEGKFYHKNGTTEVEEIELDVSAGLNYVNLNVTRDSDDRTVGSVELQIDTALQESTEQNQYLEIGLVMVEDDAITMILQLRHDNIGVCESLVIDNGEFKLASLEILGKNIYDTPEA
jgi:hypothetical protein